MKKELRFIGKKFIGGSIAAVAFIAVAGTSLWALAAFTEPTTGPAASIQDFATNVLGANNTDNSFDSSSVTANADGSVLERLEKLEAEVGGPTAITAEVSYRNLQEAIEGCLQLSTTAQYAFGQSNTSTTYTDWRLPTAEELEVFKPYSSDSSILWTNTQRPSTYSSANGGTYTTLRPTNYYVSSMTSSTFSGEAIDQDNYYRCVR